MYEYEEAPEYVGRFRNTTRFGEGAAWRVLGWETQADEDSVWTGMFPRTGQLVVAMVGDDTYFLADPEDLEPLKDSEYCSECGQIGCPHGACEDDEEE